MTPDTWIARHSELLTIGLVAMFAVVMAYAGYVLWLDFREQSDHDRPVP